MNDGIDAHLCGPATAILPQLHESCDRLGTRRRRGRGDEETVCGATETVSRGRAAVWWAAGGDGKGGERVSNKSARGARRRRAGEQLLCVWERVRRQERQQQWLCNCRLFMS